MKVRVLVLTGYGTNCERESAYAAKKAGAEVVEIAFFSDIVQERIKIEEFNFLIFPGGFLDGDHLGAAQAAAIRLKYSRTNSGHSILEKIKKLHQRGGIILGICNGFQLLTKLGMLPATEGNYFQREISLSLNDSARFEDRWVYLKCNPKSKCIFTRGIDKLYLPVRHGEGKVVPRHKSLLELMQKHGHIAVQYTDRNGRITLEYPYNPNGSPLGIAGICDPSGRIFGLMPHPEAYNHYTNHPKWTRGMRESITGISLFENAISYLRKEQ